jgi:hypothetical protein
MNRKHVGAAVALILFFAGIHITTHDNRTAAQSAGTGDLPSDPGAGARPTTSTSETTPHTTTVSAGPDPITVAHQAADIARNAPTAVDAAIGFLELAEHAVQLPPVDAAQLQRAITTPANADRIAADTHTRVAALQQSAPDGIRLWIAPVATDTQPQTDQHIRVRVWNVRIIAFGNEHITAEWVTTTYTLEHGDDGWLINTIDSEPGPTPNPGSRHPDRASDILHTIGRWQPLQ